MIVVQHVKGWLLAGLFVIVVVAGLLTYFTQYQGNYSSGQMVTDQTYYNISTPLPSLVAAQSKTQTNTPDQNSSLDKTDSLEGEGDTLMSAEEISATVNDDNEPDNVNISVSGEMDSSTSAEEAEEEETVTTVTEQEVEEEQTDKEGEDIHTKPETNGEQVDRSKCLKVVTYNILEGILKHPDRMSRLITYLQEGQFDVIALQELNNWSPSLLSTKALLWGHSFTAFLPTPYGYNLGITSSLPFETIQLRTAGFHHGMVHIRMFDNDKTTPVHVPVASSVGFNDAYEYDDSDEPDISEIVPDHQISLHILVSHLDPHNSTERFLEAHHIERQSREHPRLILMGDMNSLSSRDAQHYVEQNVIQNLKSSAALATKFLYQPDTELEIDYRVMDKFYYEGDLIDLQPVFAPFEASVPSDINDDPYHIAPLRIDYILATQEVASKCTFAHIDRNNVTNLISDHFPVIATFCFR